MGRNKVQLKLIEEPRNRLVTYRKRKEGLKKKASELSILCNIPVVMISTAPNGQVETWPENNEEVHKILSQYISLIPTDRDKHKLDMISYLNVEIRKLQAELDRMAKPHPFTDMVAEDDVGKQAHWIDSKLEEVRERIQLLNGVKYLEGNGIGSNGDEAGDIISLDQQQQKLLNLNQYPAPIAFQPPANFGRGAAALPPYMPCPYGVPNAYCGAWLNQMVAVPPMMDGSIMPTMGFAMNPMQYYPMDALLAGPELNNKMANDNLPTEL